MTAVVNGAAEATAGVSSFAAVAVGTTNAAKVAAVEHTVRHFAATGAAFLQDSKLLPFKVSSDISEQPMTMEETQRGAENRARNAHKAAREAGEGGDILAFGIESGLHITQADKRAYDLCFCCAFDGETVHHGISCAFEIPPPILKFVVEDGMDLAKACNAAGVTSNPKLGEAEGLIGILSRGRTSREEYTKQAISMALMHWENAELFRRS
eukprot:TRINITY_DN15379_c0_g1_i1.p1 TRINITY_DN15379_c0_g1~~TRINITY_DN15379_c0_g1_i1.p1  ORF type:complete len:238 (-),score=43.95 TRINITY_DN15379_c0_g1_i1:141-773(-)